jgi:hypothetical protein
VFNSFSQSHFSVNNFSGYYTIKEMVQTVNLALKGSVGALPTYPTILKIVCSSVGRAEYLTMG